MATVAKELQERLLPLIDAAIGALERGDRSTAAVKYAEASSVLFGCVADCKGLDEKLALVGRGRQLLATAAALRGEAAPDEGRPSDARVTATTAPRLDTGVTFNDVAGMEDVKETLRLRVIYPRQNPQKAARYGLQMGGGMLLYGPPGTGKTMLAKAVAGELNLPFFVIMPAEILSQFYGQSEKQLAEMFRAARNCPEGAVVFLDEIDAIGAARNRDGASEPSRRVLTQLLQELDGIHGHPTGMLFLAATNEPWLLDDALLRPPRFTEKCYVPLPDTDCRRVLLQHRFRQCPLEPGFDLDRLVGRTEGYSGADLINLCERAKMIPYRESITSGVDRPVTAADFEDAFRRVRPSVSPDRVRTYQQWEQKS